MLHSHFPHFFHKWYPLLRTVLFSSALGACSFFCRVALCMCLNQFPSHGQLRCFQSSATTYSAAKNPLVCLSFHSCTGHFKVEEVGQGQVPLQFYRYFQVALPPLSMGALVLLWACPQTELATGCVILISIMQQLSIDLS